MSLLSIPDQEEGGAFNSIELLTTLCDSTIQILWHNVSTDGGAVKCFEFATSAQLLQQRKALHRLQLQWVLQSHPTT